jgi:excinuclease ABC subunit A
VPKLKKAEKARHRRRHRPRQGAAGLAAAAWPKVSKPALRIADGRAIALEMDGGREHLFSSKSPAPSAAIRCELEPRLFSFNSPVGACPSCDGLGRSPCSTPSAWSPSRR